MELSPSIQDSQDGLVEVQGDNFAYYKAHVVDVLDGEVRIKFDGEWQHEACFPFSRVRLPPPNSLAGQPAPQPAASASSSISPSGDAFVVGGHKFTADEEVEVFSRASEQENCGWWRAYIKMSKGDFHVVDYLGCDKAYTEIVPADRLRPKSTEPSINQDTFGKTEIELPKEIKDFYTITPEDRHPDLHRDFKEAINACHIAFIKDRGVLRVIYKDPGTKRKVTMLQDMHFRNISLRASLRKKTEEAAR